MKRTSLSALLLFVTMAGCGQDAGLATVEKLVRAQFPDVEQISTEQLAESLESDSANVVVLDTRTREEYDVSHLPGAIWLSPDATVFPELDHVDHDSRIVAYCSVGYRSSEIASRLQEAGFTDVANLEGSIFRWANEGRPVVREGDEVQGVHPYNKTWGRFLDDELHDYGDATNQ